MLADIRCALRLMRQTPVFAASVLNFVSWREQIERFDAIGAVGVATSDD